MKTVVFLLIVIALCINCNRENPPSTADNAQEDDIKYASPSRNTMAGPKENEKNLTAIRESKALTVYIDPETGEFITPEEAEAPPEERLTPSAAYSTSHEGLEERPSPVPGGGTMVDLKGRFQSPLTATIDSNGDIKIEHRDIESKE
jgi:hypothetical protein